MTKLVLIAARDMNGVIGFNGGLPWSIPEDLAFFKRTTMGAPIIMGRKTHESIGFALPGRENIVITSKATRHFKGCITATSLDAALAYCEHHEHDEVFVIGGESIYRQAMPLASKLILTMIYHEFKGDTYFPPTDMHRWVETYRESQRSAVEPWYTFAFITYERPEDVQRRSDNEQAMRFAFAGKGEVLTPELLAIAHGSVAFPPVWGQPVSEFITEKQGAVMGKQYKHPGHILAIDKDFTDNLPGMGLQHGLSPLMPSEYATWLDIAGAETVIRQRDGLELNPAYRQILPYTIVAFSDDHLENWKDIEVQSYQRTKKVGEERLGGKFSVGFGGHIDKTDVATDDDSIVLLKETIQHNLEREVGREELRFVTADGIEVNPTDHPELFRFAHLGFIRDDSNNVGKVHLGLVNIIFIPRSFTVSVREEELKDGPRLTFAQLRESGLDFENWSRILIDDMSGNEATIYPALVRTPEYDMLTGQFYIPAVKGDKLGEIAIEFNTTVRKLLRLNLHLNESHVAGVVAGTRVNVPDQDSVWLAPVEVPKEWLAASNSTPEQRQAIFTAEFLKLVKDTSTDAHQHGLRYLVTEQMLERLLDLDPELSSLVALGVLKVVEDEPEGAANFTGEVVANEDVEAGFRRQVVLGNLHHTGRYVLQEGDSIDSICALYVIDKADFERWNGFEKGNAWPTHTGYVFIEDPSKLSDNPTVHITAHIEDTGETLELVARRVGEPAFPDGKITPVSAAEWTQHAGFAESEEPIK